MIAKSEAIVLKSIKYGDTSKIITLFTKNYGKVSLIAKGARKPKNKFGSSLNPLSYININFYMKPNRDLQILNNSDIILHFANIDINYNSLLPALILAEFVNNITDKTEVNKDIFKTLLESLKLINNNISKAYNYVLKSFIILSDLTGFKTSFKYQDKELDNIVFSLEDGKPILTLPQNNNFYYLSNNSIKILSKLQKKLDYHEISSLQISKEIFIECINFFVKYFNFHLDKNFKLKTLNLLQQL